MTIESTANAELAPESGDHSDEAAMALLAAKRQPAQDDVQDDPEPNVAEDADEGDDAPQDDAEDAVEDDDPEIDLGEIKLKKSELKAGYMKDADYRRKTAEAAEVKREAQAERERIQQERSHYANHLDVVLGSLQAQLIGDQAQLAELAATDPAEWVRQNAAFQKRYADYQTALQERSSLANRMTAEQEKEVADWRKSERDKLTEKLPEWRDPTKAAAEQKLVAEYLLGVGYTPDDLSELFDHRALIVARKAALYDQLQAAKAKQAKPEPPRAQKPGAAQRSQPNNQAYQDALRRAKSTGSEDDVMRLLQLKRQK